MKNGLRALFLSLLLLGLAGEVSAQVVFNELLLKRSGGSPTVDQLVELKNTGASTVDIGGWVFCHQFDYSAVIPTGTTIPAGGLLTIHFNQAGINSATDIYYAGELLDDPSDLALYVNGSNFALASNMRVFVQFGGAPASGRASVAVQAGLWTSTNAFVPLPAAGQSVELCASNAGDVSSWAPTASPTIGSPNGCGVPTRDVSWGSVKALFRQ